MEMYWDTLYVRIIKERQILSPLQFQQDFFYQNQDLFNPFINVQHNTIANNNNPNLPSQPFSNLYWFNVNTATFDSDQNAILPVENYRVKEILSSQNTMDKNQGNMQLMIPITSTKLQNSSNPTLQKLINKSLQTRTRKHSNDNYQHLFQQTIQELQQNRYNSNGGQQQPQKFITDPFKVSALAKRNKESNSEFSRQSSDKNICEIINLNKKQTNNRPSTMMNMQSKLATQNLKQNGDTMDFMRSESLNKSRICHIERSDGCLNTDQVKVKRFLEESFQKYQITSRGNMLQDDGDHHPSTESGQIQQLEVKKKKPQSSTKVKDYDYNKLEMTQQQMKLIKLDFSKSPSSIQFANSSDIYCAEREISDIYSNFNSGPQVIDHSLASGSTTTGFSREPRRKSQTEHFLNHVKNRRRNVNGSHSQNVRPQNNMNGAQQPPQLPEINQQIVATNKFIKLSSPIKASVESNLQINTVEQIDQCPYQSQQPVVISKKFIVKNSNPQPRNQRNCTSMPKENVNNHQQLNLIAKIMNKRPVVHNSKTFNKAQAVTMQIYKKIQ